MRDPILSYGQQLVDDDDIAAVVEVLRGDWLTGGPTVAKFEETFAKTVGAGHAIACSSGTAALHMAAIGVGLGAGDRVVVPSLTFLATANAARFVGAEVVFADVDPNTGLLTPETFAAALTRADGDVRAVFPVHLNGQTVDMTALFDIAGAQELCIVEDAAHAAGTRYATGGSMVGSGEFSDAACFSFHPVKTLTMGEGGLVTTNDPALAERVRRARNHGMVRDAAAFQRPEFAFDADGAANPWYYEMPEIGFNYRASDIHCALGLSQLTKLERFAATRIALAARYDELLESLAPLVVPIRRMPDCRPVWHLYSVLIDFEAAGQSRANIMRQLRDAGIGTQVHYLPVHHQPYYRGRYGELDLPGADAYYARQLSLPLSAAMAPDDVDRVVAALENVFGN